MTRSGGYEVCVKASAERDMNALPANVFKRMRMAILALESSPRPRGCKKLRGQSAYRIRVGSYRVLYTVDDPARVVEVVAVGHRREVYR